MCKGGMMKFSYGLSAVLIGAAVVLVQPQLALSLTQTEITKIAREITVRIDGDGVGSGWILERKGDTYFVITNRHVLEKNDGKYKIRTADGVSYDAQRPQQLPEEVNVDLAVLEFTSKKNYPTANLGNSDQIKEKMTVYVAGWGQALGDIERGYEFQPGSILDLQTTPMGNGYTLMYNNQVDSGMSGGPLIDVNGRVVGINGFGFDWQNGYVRMAIPINTFLKYRNNLQPLIASAPTTRQQPLTRKTSANTGKPGARRTPIAPRKPTAEGLVSLGSSKANRGDYEEAIADYNAALQIDLKNLDAYLQRGNAHLKQQEYPAAIKDFKQVLSLSRNNTLAYALLAFSYYAQGNTREALANYNQALEGNSRELKQNPYSKDAWLYFNRGTVRSDLEDYQGAIKDYTQAIQINSDYVCTTCAYNSRGLVHFRLKDYQRAIDDYDQAIQRDGNFAHAYYNRGLAHRSQGNNQKALEDFRKAAQLYQQQDERSSYQDAQAKIRELENPASASQPTTPSNQTDYQAIIATATQAIQRNRKDAAAYLNRAVARYNQGDKQAALQDLNSATQINPKYSLAWYNRGFLLAELGKTSEALASYDRAIQANSEWGKISLADAYLDRGNIRSEQRDYRRAIADYTEVIRINRKSAPAYALRGMNHQRQGNNQAAIADFNQAAQIDPNNAVAFMVRGFSYHFQGDYQGALAAYEKAIALDAKLFAAVNNIGFIKYELGDVEGAIRQFQAAIDINKQSAEPQLALAVALYGKREWERGLTMAQAALRLDKRFADVKFLKEQLWGDRILAETKKVLESPKIKEITSRPSRGQ
jgi:tetratricopeptide (TPR) repeat protein